MREIGFESMRRGKIHEEFIGKKYVLPFCDHKIELDETGVKVVACLSCRMALNNSSPLESNKQYAERMAAFIIGNIVASFSTDRGKLSVFQEILPKIICWIDESCGSLDDSPDLSVFGELADSLQ